MWDDTTAELVADAAGHPCAVHNTHTPTSITSDWHHVIPVGFQTHTTPPIPPPYPGNDPEGRGLLWDARGIWVCPTGHRNTHWWLVALMHALNAAGNDNVTAAVLAVKPRRPPADFNIALSALTRYQAEAPDASLLALTQAGEWGQA